MSVFPDQEQRRRNRRPPASKVLFAGLVFGVVMFILGAAGIGRETSVLEAVGLALVFILVIGGISLSLRAKDQRRSAG